MCNHPPTWCGVLGNCLNKLRDLLPTNRPCTGPQDQTWCDVQEDEYSNDEEGRRRWQALIAHAQELLARARQHVESLEKSVPSVEEVCSASCPHLVVCSSKKCCTG